MIVFEAMQQNENAVKHTAPERKAGREFMLEERLAKRIQLTLAGIARDVGILGDTQILGSFSNGLKWKFSGYNCYHALRFN